MVYHIFIGYDEREHTPFQAAKHSLQKHATVPIHVHKLHHKELRSSGLFTREWITDKDGQYIDSIDGKPFSTQFSHSRFLVPELWKNVPSFNKSSLTMFVDCDFVWLDDIGKMFKEIENRKLRQNSPVYCVQHDYKPVSQFKMDNVEQSAYNKKLWSAMLVFNMEHKDCSNLTPEYVNKATGRELHTFEWVQDKHNIGTISERWHFLPNHSEKNLSHEQDGPAAIHYTEGGPWFKNHRNCKYANVWWDAYREALTSKVKTVDFNLETMIDG